MEIKLTKEKAQELMKIPGEVRGVGIKSDWEVILREKGKEGLKKLEEKMAELGYPLKYEEIKEMNFYPLGYDAISVLAIKEIFNFDEKELEEFESKAIRFSIFLRIFLRYTISPNLLIKEAPKMWRRHYTVGDLEIVKFDKKEKIVILRLKNFAIHSLYCIILKSYFAKTLEIVVGSKVNSKETKCTFREDEYHEFLFTWN
jgi:hypothetical protein